MIIDNSDSLKSLHRVLGDIAENAKQIQSSLPQQDDEGAKNVKSSLAELTRQTDDTQRYLKRKLNKLEEYGG